MRTLDCHFLLKLLRCVFFFFFFASAASRRSGVEAFELNFLLYDMCALAFANDILCSLNFSKLILDVFFSFRMFCMDVYLCSFERCWTMICVRACVCPYIMSPKAGCCSSAIPPSSRHTHIHTPTWNKLCTDEDVSNDKYWMEIIKSMLCWILNKFHIPF